MEYFEVYFLIRFRLTLFHKIMVAEKNNFSSFYFIKLWWQKKIIFHEMHNTIAISFDKFKSEKCQSPSPHPHL